MNYFTRKAFIIPAKFATLVSVLAFSACGSQKTISEQSAAEKTNQTTNNKQELLKTDKTVPNSNGEPTKGPGSIIR